MESLEQHERRIREFLARSPFNIRGLDDAQIKIFSEAFIHDSYTNEAHNLPNNPVVQPYERLEFLGDSIVEFVACDEIYRISSFQEGMMTDFKKEVVANKKISTRVLEAGIDLDSLMLAGKDVSESRRKGNLSWNIRADAFEALVAATYLVCGMDKARELVKNILIKPALLSWSANTE